MPERFSDQTDPRALWRQANSILVTDGASSLHYSLRHFHYAWRKSFHGRLTPPHF